ncbi:MAG: hypothetical protein KIT49_01535 [Nitrospira sp.]|nr:hypothetical protein [Nitrospira sp.]
MLAETDENGVSDRDRSRTRLSKSRSSGVDGADTNRTENAGRKDLTPREVEILR